MLDLCYPLSMTRWRSIRATGFGFLTCCALCGCRTTPDYARPLAPGEHALRIVAAPETIAGLASAFENKSDQLILSMDRSLAWFDGKESKRFFPWTDPPITHTEARQSLLALRELIERAKSAAQFVHEITERFDIYESVGYDGNGTVFFTGYFAPEYPARRQRTDVFQFPLYDLPSALRAKYIGQGRWPTRREIEDEHLLAGYELAWLDDPLNAYLIHVNGSGCLRLADNDSMYVGYTATNEHEYTSLGRLLVDEGVLGADEVSMQTIRAAFNRVPTTVGAMMLKNDRYVFFTERKAGEWPLASLGIRLTSEASIATDKKVFPPGGLILVQFGANDETGGTSGMARFMLDQDSGGAIKGPGRADLFMGVGERAGEVAGTMTERGGLFYVFLKRF